MLEPAAEKIRYQAPKPALCWQVRCLRFLPTTWLLYLLRFIARWVLWSITLFFHVIGQVLLWCGMKRWGQYACYLQMDISQAVLFGRRHMARLHVDRQTALDRIARICEADEADNAYDLKKLAVMTHDGAFLDTVEFMRREKYTYDNPAEQCYIIKLLGRDQRYENRLRRYLKLAKDRDANVILFNYRGVGNSRQKPLVFQDLVTDGIAQVQRVLDRFWAAHPDLRPDATSPGTYPMIVLEGFSLGGAVATLVTRYFHDQGIKVFLFNDRSFSSLTNTVVGMVIEFLQKLGVALWLSQTLAYTLWLPTKIVLLTLGWDASIAHIYTHHIPRAYREYTVVPAAAGMKLKRFSQAKDHVINYEHASLHKSRHLQKHHHQLRDRLVKAIKRRHKRVQRLTKQLRIAEKQYQHLCHLEKQSHYLSIARKMTGITHRHIADAHRTSLDTLSNVHGVLGSDVTRSFYQRSCAQHEQDIGKS